MALKLKPGKEIPLTHRHHWIFSGAVAEISQDTPDGAITDVISFDGHFLAQAYINRKSALIARVVSFDHTKIPEVLREKISSAWQLRLELFDKTTNCYRIINSEGDGIPGLIVDRYGNVLVIQSTTLGIDTLLPTITSILLNVASRIQTGEWSIYLKSTSPSRREEGLDAQTRWLNGPEREHVTVLEDGLQFQVSPVTGQKTGLFLDQREMRRLVGMVVNNKKVLNCFSYTGGFSLHALRGGATHVTSVDSSKEAIAELDINRELNGFSKDVHTGCVADVFQFLESQKTFDYGFVILDPPAFAKTKNDVPEAMRAYRSLNALAMAKMPPRSFLLTSSCSYHVDPTLFQKLVFQAAREAKRNVRILERHRQAPDHPINIYHPEGEYLKSLLLFLE